MFSQPGEIPEKARKPRICLIYVGRKLMGQDLPVVHVGPTTDADIDKMVKKEITRGREGGRGNPQRFLERWPCNTVLLSHFGGFR